MHNPNSKINVFMPLNQATSQQSMVPLQLMNFITSLSHKIW